MRLIPRILLHMSWALTLLLGAWAVLFYFTMIDQINDEVDDALENYSEQLVTRALAGREMPSAAQGNNHSYYLREITAEYAVAHPQVAYADEMVFIAEKEETEPARVLRTMFRNAEGRYFELTVMTPTIEKEDLREAILWWVVWLYLLLLLTVLGVNLLLLYRTMRPLYALLRWLDDYTVGRKNTPLRSEPRVTEFRKLNEAAVRSAVRTEYLFERQKQFVGNASHEMQTPLAVCRNRLEMLVGDGSTLTEEQLGEVMKVQQTLDYLVRLNRSLLLLSKIDSGQFPEASEVDINELVRSSAEQMAEIYASRGISLEVREQGALHARMNPSLAASVVSNLLKNAFVHNIPGGEVVAEVTPRVLRVYNSGITPLDAAHLFERFYQGAKKEGSTGLGLSIVDAVCRHYGFRVTYNYEQGRHCFTVQFGASR